MNGSLHLNWLIRSRWLILLTQAALVVLTDLATPFEVPTAILLGLIGVLAATNLGLSRLVESPHAKAWLVATLVLDLVILTVGLGMSGGPMNPFSSFYVVYVALGALVFDRMGIALTALLAILGYGSLYVVGDSGHHHHDHQWMQWHLDGMWVAMASTAVLIAYFVHILNEAVASQNKQLREMRQSRERYDRAAMLTSMAAGAAHELATPLSTIAVAAKSLSTEIDQPYLREDALAIRDETERCRAILKRLSYGAGDTPGEGFEVIELDELVARALENTQQGEIEVEVEVESGSIRAPVETVVEAWSALIQNAVDAHVESQERGPLRLHVQRSERDYEMMIEDRGGGIDEDIIELVREPFYSTKSAPDRMGLGLFVAEMSARRLGGTLEIDTDATGSRIMWRAPLRPQD